MHKKRTGAGHRTRRLSGLQAAARIAGAGSRVLNAAAALLILLLLLYGGYSLWDTVMIYRGAFAGEELLQYKPVGERQENPTLKELQGINPDVRAWVTVEGTHIDYPVVQGKTNMEYINKDVFGDFSLSGSVFLDCRNQPDFSDGYNLLYGHHMDNGGVFSDVAEFTGQDYFDSHQKGELYLPGGTHAFQMFACVETDAFDSVIFSPGGQGDQMDIFLAYVRDNAVQYREIGVTASDSIIGLSTCAEAETNGRVIIFGRLEE